MIPLRPGYSCYCRYGYISVETTPPPFFTHPPPPPFLFFHIWDFPTFLPKRLLNWYGRYSLIYLGWFSPTLFRFSFKIAAFFPPAAGKRHVRNAKFSAVIWLGVFISNSFSFLNLVRLEGKYVANNYYVIKLNEFCF